MSRTMIFRKGSGKKRSFLPRGVHRDPSGYGSNNVIHTNFNPTLEQSVGEIPLPDPGPYRDFVELWRVRIGTTLDPTEADYRQYVGQDYGLENMNHVFFHMCGGEYGGQVIKDRLRFFHHACRNNVLGDNPKFPLKQIPLDEVRLYDKQPGMLIEHFAAASVETPATGPGSGILRQRHSEIVPLREILDEELENWIRGGYWMTPRW
jgi:hypothetical protein